MKPAKPSSRRPKPSKNKFIGIEVPAATPKQLATLKKLFKTTAISTLGIPPSAAIQKQALVARRRRGR